MGRQQKRLGHLLGKAWLKKGGPVKTTVKKTWASIMESLAEKDLGLF
jgi:hypothetical protein